MQQCRLWASSCTCAVDMSSEQKQCQARMHAGKKVYDWAPQGHAEFWRHSTLLWVPSMAQLSCAPPARLPGSAARPLASPAAVQSHGSQPGLPLHGRPASQDPLRSILQDS